MPRYDGYTLAQVKAAIEPGAPSTLSSAATIFAAVREALDTVATALPGAVAIVTTGPTGAWSGPAAEAFIGVADGIVEVISSLRDSLDPYDTALDGAATALTTAQAELAAYAAQVPVGPVAEADAEEINAGARAILETLA